jgi:hypothetical protein
MASQQYWSGFLHSSIQAAIAASALDSLNESLQLNVIQAHFASSNRAAALNIFEVFRKQLRDEL